MVSDDSAREKIAKLYMEYGPLVLRRCRKLLRNEDLARDAMHEVFVKVMGRTDSSPIENEAKYLFRSATHVCIDMIRAQKIRINLGAELLNDIACVGDSEQRALSGLWIEKIFRNQKADAREIAVMVYIDGMTHRETALALGVSQKTVQKRLKALQKECHSLCRGSGA